MGRYYRDGERLTKQEVMDYIHDVKKDLQKQLYSMQDRIEYTSEYKTDFIKGLGVAALKLLGWVAGGVAVIAAAFGVVAFVPAAVELLTAETILGVAGGAGILMGFNGIGESIMDTASAVERYKRLKKEHPENLEEQKRIENEIKKIESLDYDKLELYVQLHKEGKLDKFDTYVAVTEIYGEKQKVRSGQASLEIEIENNAEMVEEKEDSLELIKKK